MLISKKSKFLRIACPRCASEQIVFGKASTIIKCQDCNKRLIDTTGGKAKIRAKVKQILWK